MLGEPEGEVSLQTPRGLRRALQPGRAAANLTHIPRWKGPGLHCMQPSAHPFPRAVELSGAGLGLREMPPLCRQASLLLRRGPDSRGAPAEHLKDQSLPRPVLCAWGQSKTVGKGFRDLHLMDDLERDERTRGDTVSYGRTGMRIESTGTLPGALPLIPVHADRRFLNAKGEDDLSAQGLGRNGSP